MQTKLNLAKNKVLEVLISTLVLLCIPFGLSIFINDFQWNVFDYLVMGLLIFTSGILITTVGSIVKHKTPKLVFYVVIFAVALLIWGEMAVGIFGSPISGD